MIAVDIFKLNVVKAEDAYGEFVIGPLPKGYGVTLGNALRRILLSSIEGAAITSIKVTGVKHEYATIPGVIDDVLNIILKLKQLAFRSYSEKPQKIELKVKGKKIVTAADIELTADVEVLNLKHQITELTDSKAHLEIEMVVEKGMGYMPSDEAKRSEVGIIPIDAAFSPVQRVVMEVTKTRVEQQTDLDQISLKVYTNGVVTPKDALTRASEIYNELTSRLVAITKGEEVEEKKTSSKKEKKGSTSEDLDIDKLNLSARLTNSLLKTGYKNLTELEGKGLDDLLEIRGLGQRSAEELLEIMKSYKLKVKE